MPVQLLLQLGEAEACRGGPGARAGGRCHAEGAGGWGRILDSLSSIQVPQLHKLEQLFEQEQKVHTFLMNWVGLLALMLHKTIQHDPFTSDLCSRVDI